MTSASTTDEMAGRLDTERTAAVEALYRRIAPGLFVWCAMRVPRNLQYRLDPEDLTQEIWFRVLNRLESFDVTLGSFRAWVFGVASRTLAEEFRRTAVRRRVADARERSLDGFAAGLASVTQQVARREDLRMLVEELRRLDEPARNLVVFRGLEGLPHAEVGSRLGISAEAAEVRWRRLRQRLQQACGADVWID